MAYMIPPTGYQQMPYKPSYQIPTGMGNGYPPVGSFYSGGYTSGEHPPVSHPPSYFYPSAFYGQQGSAPPSEYYHSGPMESSYQPYPPSGYGSGYSSMPPSRDNKPNFYWFFVLVTWILEATWFLFENQLFYINSKSFLVLNWYLIDMNMNLKSQLPFYFLQKINPIIL